MSLPYQAMAGADASVESEPTPDDQAPSQSGPGRADHPSWYTCEHHLQERRKMITNMSVSYTHLTLPTKRIV